MNLGMKNKKLITVNQIMSSRFSACSPWLSASQKSYTEIHSEDAELRGGL